MSVRIIEPEDIYEAIFYSHFTFSVHKQSIKIIGIDLTTDDIDLFNSIFTDKIIEKKIDSDNKSYYYVEL